MPGGDVQGVLGVEGEVTWLPEARGGGATIRRSRATHPVPHGRLADNPGFDRLWSRRGWPCGDALMDALERRGRTRGGRSALDRWIKTRDRVHLQPVLKPGLQQLISRRAPRRHLAIPAALRSQAASQKSPT